MRTTVAAVCIFLFFSMALLSMYQIGATGGVLRGGYLMMASYYMNNFGDRPDSFILADKSLRPNYQATIAVYDRRSMRFFRSRLGEENVQAYGDSAWIVQGVVMSDFFGHLRGMEIGILATGSVMVLAMVLPWYFDTRSL